VKDTPIPAWTAVRDNPFITMRDVHERERIGFNTYQLARGMLLLGAAGTGKTNVNMMLVSRILQILNENDVLFVFDTKGDYLEEFAGRIPGNMLRVIGSDEIFEDITYYWNIFMEIMPRDVNGKLVYNSKCDMAALEISAQLFAGMESDTQPVFPMMAQQILATLLVDYMRKHYKTAPEKLNNKAFLEYVYAMTSEDIKTMLESDMMKDYHSMKSYIHGGKSGNQSQGVMSYLHGVLRRVFIGPFAEADKKREFAVRDLFERDQKVVVFLEYDLLRGSALSPVYSVFIDLLLKYALARKKKRKNSYLVIDEWALLKNPSKHMFDALSFGRDQGVKLICGLQNVNAITAIYGEDDAKSIMAGFQTVIGLRVMDAESRQFLAEHSGKNYQNIAFTSNTQNRDAQREGYAVEDWDIHKLSCGQAVVTMPDTDTFLFSFPKYEEWKQGKE
jgi:type IV secretory pathway TraG/TraD family ATPase VirD4